MQYFCLLFSLCVHEAAHAAMANACGDPSARLLGRVTLNPAKHVDILGTVVFPLLIMVTGAPGFGWAKPVPFNPRNLNNMRRDPVLIAMAGPGSNLIIAVCCAIILKILATLLLAGFNAPIIVTLILIMKFMVVINFVLILFNLIPVPPLDGHYVLKYFLPPSMEEAFERIGPFGIIIAIVIAQPLLGPPLRFLMNAVEWFAFGGLGQGLG
jgi:Zn-dependent protease